MSTIPSAPLPLNLPSREASPQQWLRQCKACLSPNPSQKMVEDLHREAGQLGILWNQARQWDRFAQFLDAWETWPIAASDPVDKALLRVVAHLVQVVYASAYMQDSLALINQVRRPVAQRLLAEVNPVKQEAHLFAHMAARPEARALLEELTPTVKENVIKSIYLDVCQDVLVHRLWPTLHVLKDLWPLATPLAAWAIQAMVEQAVKTRRWNLPMLQAFVLPSFVGHEKAALKELNAIVKNASFQHLPIERFWSVADAVIERAPPELRRPWLVEHTDRLPVTLASHRSALLTKRPDSHARQRPRA